LSKPGEIYNSSVCEQSIGDALSERVKETQRWRDQRLTAFKKKREMRFGRDGGFKKKPALLWCYLSFLHLRKF